MFNPNCNPLYFSLLKNNISIEEIWNELDFVLLQKSIELLELFHLENNAENCSKLILQWLNSCNNSDYLPLENIINVVMNKIGAYSTMNLIALHSNRLKHGIFSSR